MADTVISTLYPPLIETFQPSFLYNNNAIITFSLSPFNSINDIQSIHVSVVDQRNNTNVLQTIKNPVQQQDENEEITEYYYGITNGILIIEMPKFDYENQDKQKNGLVWYDPISNLYAINISPNLLLDRDEDGYWNNNQYYQVQIRFDSCETELWHNNGELTSDFAKYMLDKREYFSEWSSVTLIKPILEPVISIAQLSTNDTNQTYPGSFHISGCIVFDTEVVNTKNGLTAPETERLQLYKIMALLDDEIIYDSDWIYARQNIGNENYTTIDHLIFLSPAKVSKDDEININISCKTNNGYFCQKDYILTIQAYSDYWSNIRWNNILDEDANLVYINQEDGIAHINFSAICENSGIVYFKRASSKNNFETWDLIYQYQYNIADSINNKLEVSFDDYTIGSLYQYKYSAQICITTNNKETWGQIAESSIIYPQFYEMLLMRQNKQIAIRYNGQVSSWKPTVNRQKIDTLGGKYPKFVENAAMNYKTYSISGLITAEKDFNRKFLNEYDDENVQYYNDVFGTKYTIRNDTIADGEIVDSSVYDFHRVIPKFEVVILENEDIRVPVTEEWYELNNNEYLLTIDTIIDITKTYYKKNGYKREILNTGYPQLNSQHDTYLQDHWYWEREFREQLVNWLNDGEPKLYRSMPEGNLAVMLTDINLTPNEQLGRRLYNFSATMYEIGNGYSLDTLEKLNIITIPKSDAVFLTGANFDNIDNDDENNGRKIHQLGQITISSTANINDWINGNTTSSNIPTDLWSNMSIREQLNEYYNGIYNSSNDVHDIVPNSIKLTNLTIQFHTPPQYFEYDDNQAEGFKFTISSNETEWLGYVINIKTNVRNNNFQQIFINSKGFYHIPDSTTIQNLTILGSNIAQQATLTYECQYQLQTDASKKLYDPIKQKTIIGQYTADTMPLKQDIISLIYQDYEKIVYLKNSYNRWYLNKCEGLLLDLTPYAYIKYSYMVENDDNTKTLETGYLTIGQTGIFNAFDNWPLESLYILGKRMVRVNEYPYQIEDWEYYIYKENNAQPSYNTANEITNLYFNTVYKINNKNQIYYIDGHWYPMSDNFNIESTTAIAEVPIYGMINYHGDLVKVVY